MRALCLSKQEGKKVSERGLSRRAKLKSEAHVGHLKRGLVERPSGEMLEAIARAGGVSVAWFISGNGDPFAGKNVSTVSDRVHPVIAAAAKAARYTNHEAELASLSIRGLTGTASMTEEQALEFLQKAGMTIRDNTRALASSDEDELPGGLSGTPRLQAVGHRVPRRLVSRS